MSSGTDASDALAAFQDDARAAGLALPTARRLSPSWAVVAAVVVVGVSLTVGYATNWFELNRPPANPLASLPSCPPGGVSLAVSTESVDAGGLAEAWPSVAQAFSQATGNCLTTASSATVNGFGSLSSRALDGLVGPELPPSSLASQVLEVPLMVSPVVVLANLNGTGSAVTLSANALAGIYLGTVDSWSSPAITATNPRLASTLPITPVAIAGASSVNLPFSAYLSEWNSTFRDALGSGTNLSWPAPVDLTTADDVAAVVASVPGAVGYTSGLPCPAGGAVVCASIQSGLGSFDLPTAATVIAAANVEGNSTGAASSNWSNVTGAAPTNATVYPMVENSYAVVYRDLGTAYGAALSYNESKWLIGLLFWVAADSYGTAGPLEEAAGYYPLPGAFALGAEEMTLTVTYLGGWILLPAGSLQEGAGEGNEGGETGEF